MAHCTTGLGERKPRGFGGVSIIK